MVRRLLTYRSLSSAEMIYAESQTAADVRYFDRHVVNLDDAAAVDRARGGPLFRQADRRSSQMCA